VCEDAIQSDKVGGPVFAVVPSMVNRAVSADVEGVDDVGAAERDGGRADELAAEGREIAPAAAPALVPQLVVKADAEEADVVLAARDGDRVVREEIPAVAIEREPALSGPPRFVHRRSATANHEDAEFVFRPRDHRDMLINAEISENR